MYYWIGADDMGREGRFRFINGREMVANEDTLFRWQSGQYQDVDGTLDCVYVYTPTMEMVYATCTTELYGVCEIKTHQNCIV